MDEKLNNENQGQIIKQFPEKIKDNQLLLTRVVKKGNDQEVQFFYRCGRLNNEPTFCKFSLPLSVIDIDFRNANSKEEIIKIIEDSQQKRIIRKNNLSMSFNIDTLEQIKNNTNDNYKHNFFWNKPLKKLDEFFIQHNLSEDCHPLHSSIFFLRENYKYIDSSFGVLIFLLNTLETENDDLTKEIKPKLEEFKKFLFEKYDNKEIEEKFDEILSLTKQKTKTSEKQDIKLEGYKQQTQNTDDINKMNMTKIIEENSNNISSLIQLKTKIPPEGEKTKFEKNEINNDSCCCCCKGCSLFSCCPWCLTTSDRIKY